MATAPEAAKSKSDEYELARSARIEAIATIEYGSTSTAADNVPGTKVRRFSDNTQWPMAFSMKAKIVILQSAT